MPLLRTLCLLVALLGALASQPRAAEPRGSDAQPACCAALAGAVAEVEPAAEGSCCCAPGACHCATAPQRGCDCAKKAPAPRPSPAEPVVPKPPPIACASSRRSELRVVPPHLAFAQRLRAATASGLGNVLLPGRSRQVALSVWRC